MLTPHSIIHGDACFAYFNKIWGIPRHWAKGYFGQWQTFVLPVQAGRRRLVQQAFAHEDMR
jgi:hypothetical protein